MIDEDQVERIVRRLEGRVLSYVDQQQLKFIVRETLKGARAPEVQAAIEKFSEAAGHLLEAMWEYDVNQYESPETGYPFDADFEEISMRIWCWFDELPFKKPGLTEAQIENITYDVTKRDFKPWDVKNIIRATIDEVQKRA